jgi:lipopolysaccharide/colanic/teichoic acid biosynthesis glycosyltransferase
VSVELLSVPTRVSRTGPYALTKRVLDILVASVILLLFFPVFAAIAAIIFATDRGPIIYRQKRVGRDGRHQCRCAQGTPRGAE